MIVSSAVRLIDGEVVKGFRHGQAFELAFEKHGREAQIGSTQGFVTDRGLFLNRVKAAKHAIRCGQVKKVWRHLYSETVWPHDLPEWGTRPPLWELWRRP